MQPVSHISAIKSCHLYRYVRLIPSVVLLGVKVRVVNYLCIDHFPNNTIVGLNHVDIGFIVLVRRSRLLSVIKPLESTFKPSLGIIVEISTGDAHQTLASASKLIAKVWRLHLRYSEAETFVSVIVPSLVYAYKTDIIRMVTVVIEAAVLDDDIAYLGCRQLSTKIGVVPGVNVGESDTPAAFDIQPVEPVEVEIAVGHGDTAVEIRTDIYVQPVTAVACGGHIGHCDVAVGMDGDAGTVISQNKNAESALADGHCA